MSTIDPWSEPTASMGGLSLPLALSSRFWLADSAAER